MRRVQQLVLDAVPFVPFAIILAAVAGPLLLTQCGDDATQSRRPAEDTGGDPGDLSTDPSDDEPAEVVCFEDRGERRVADQCALETDRVCLDDSHCRSTERCVVNPGDALGTCIYQLPPPITCPGDPTCPEAGGAPLRAAFAVRPITPLGWEEPRPDFMDGRTFEGDPENTETFFDCGRDMVCPDDAEYQGPDADGSEGDERMQGIWMAGLHESVPALRCPSELVGPQCTGVDCCAHERAHDDIWARGALFEQGESKVAVVALDLIGYFYNDLQDVASALPAELGIDLLVVASTHSHEGPDTMGLWGPGSGGSDLPVESGVDPDHIAAIRDQIVALLTEANANLVEVDLYATQVQTGVELVAGNDTRDPWIFNDHMALLQVVEAGGDRSNPEDTVGVLVNWGNHPESIGPDNHHISSDYPHYVRTYIEQGLPPVMNDGEPVPAVDGLGGPVVFLSGTLGGLTTPLHTSAMARDGTIVSENGFAKADAMGQQLAQMALEALAEAPAVAEDLSFGRREVIIGVPNLRFHIAIFSLDLFPEREIYNWRFSDGFTSDAPPNLLTALARVQIGPVTLATVPGEMFPETVVGGFSVGDSEAQPVRGNPNETGCMDDLLPPEAGDNGDDAVHPCLIDPDNPNPPDLDAAPDGGFAADVLPGDVLFLIGNGMDSIGYLVPAYDFVLDENAPYVTEPDGDHYEETNSVGGPVLRTVLDEMEMLFSVEGLFE